MRHINSCRLLAVAMLLAAGTAAADETYKLDIPAQPLSKALRIFAEQSGIQIVYYAQIAEGQTASRVLGTLSAKEALAALLAGTKLRFETVNADTVAIRQMLPQNHGSASGGIGAAREAEELEVMRFAQGDAPQAQTN